MTLRVRDLGRLRIAALVTAVMLVSAAGAEVRYLPLATIVVGDKPADVMSRSDAFLTEYRFESGGHSYALARALQGAEARVATHQLTLRLIKPPQ